MVELNNTLVSIIIPVYKVEQYLKRCVDSILNQTHPTLEIILVDDGSTDNCPAICDEYAKKDKRIKVIHKENGGLSSARNIGLDSAKGDFIFFIDSDDWIENNTIEFLLNIARKTNADITVGESFNNPHLNKKVNSGNIVEFTFNEACTEEFLGNTLMFTVVWGKLYRASLWTDLRFPSKKIHEDVFLTHKLHYNANKIVYTSLSFYHYTIRRGGLSQRKFSSDIIEASEERLNFIKDKGISKDVLGQALQELAWLNLYAYSQTFINSPKDAQTFIKNAQKYCKRLSSDTKGLFTHKFFLSLFTKFPSLYLFYQRRFSFKIRKKL